MRWIIGIIITIALFALVFAAWVRLAPSDPQAWHRLPAPQDRPGAETGPNWIILHEWIAGDPTEVLASIDAAARATPRTEVLAGSVESGMITYVTRSRLWAFPDYTTVAIGPEPPGGTGYPTLTVWGRSRFGQSDLGVNAERVRAWFAAVPQDLLAP